MTRTARRPTSIRFRQAANLRLRTMETWRCQNGHEFGVDPDVCGSRMPRCPQMLDERQGCAAKVERVSKAGVLR